MRIGIDYTAAVRQQAGIGRYTRSLIGALARLDQTNDYVLFSAGRDPAAHEWPPNFGTRSVPLSDRHMSAIWHKLRIPLPIEWITGPLDLFHSPDFVLPPVRRARTVLTIHDLSFLRHPECSSPSLLSYLMRAVPPSLARADLILADSESTRRDLVELLSVDPSRIRVIYPAVDPTFRPSDAACVQGVRELYAIGEQSYILSVGTLQPRKNYVRLLQAFAQIRRDSGLPHHLVIAGGPGWLYEPIYQAIQDLALGDSVHLLGYVDEGDLPALYTGAELFAFPSLYEGFGFPVLEAMACGTPVVSADSSSLPEAAGQAALLVPPTDTMALAEAMGRVLSESHTRAELIRRGYLQCRRFRWEDAARSLLTSYIETLNGETHV